MLNFRKSSITFRQEVCKLFRNEKKVRKNGMTESADFEFRQIEEEKMMKEGQTNTQGDTRVDQNRMSYLCYLRYF